MDEEHLSLTFAMDVLITTLLYLILFRGHVFSEYLCIIQNTDIVIGVLMCVVCFRSIMDVFIQRHDCTSRSLATTLFGSLFLVICGIILFDVICIIYGAPLLSSVQETLYFSSLLTCMTVVPCCCVLGPDITSWYRVLCNNNSDNSAEMTVRLCVIYSVLGAWLGAFPIPLDWDRPWQVWPVSCVYGTTLGYGFGLISSHIHIYLRQMKMRKIKLG